MKFNKKKHRKEGFSVVELVVTMVVFVVIYTIPISGGSRFNSSFKLTNLAYDIALQIRQAQTYGISVVEFGTGSGDFDLGYGVYLNSIDPLSFIFFADDDGERDYDSLDEFIDQLSITGGNFISKFCATPSSGPEECSDTGDINEMVVVFERPNPNAHIVTDVGSNYESASIEVQSQDGATRMIDIHASGQISVNSP